MALPTSDLQYRTAPTGVSLTAQSSPNLPRQDKIMAIEDKKIPYELLVRYGLDGKPAGAHVVYRRRVVMDGEVLKDEVGPAEPIDLDGFPTSDVMKDALRDALAQIAVLTAQGDELAEQVNAATETVETANERIALLVSENEELTAELARLHS